MSNIGAMLTDGTGVSSGSLTKFVKDFVADALISGAAALATIQIISVDQAVAQPMVVLMALSGALVKVLYRTVLRWANS